MQKRFALFSVASMASAALLGVVACGDSNTSTFPEGSPDSGPVEDGGPSFNVRDSGADEPPGPVDCKPAMPEAFVPTWQAPEKAAACDGAELQAHYDTCVVGGDETASACTSWKESHAACAACLEPANNNGPIQFYRDRLYYRLNVAGCLALLRGETDEEACPAKYGAAIQCQRASCDACYAQQGAMDEDFNACQAKARSGDCKEFERAAGKACGTGLMSPDGGAAECFPAEGESSASHFVRVEGIFCGK